MFNFFSFSFASCGSSNRIHWKLWSHATLLACGKMKLFYSRKCICTSCPLQKGWWYCMPIHVSLAKYKTRRVMHETNPLPIISLKDLTCCCDDAWCRNEPSPAQNPIVALNDQEWRKHNFAKCSEKPDYFRHLWNNSGLGNMQHKISAN